MGSTHEIERTSSSYPLVCSIIGPGGGVTGQSPTVAVRDGDTVNSYLDFADNTFKTSGWTIKYSPMVEVERGHYQRSINVANLNLQAGQELVAEFSVDDGGGVVGGDHDILKIVDIAADTSLVRKVITNRQEEEPGLPGRLITYDDDNVTPILDQELRDNNDGAIVSATGVPAKRTASSI